MYSYCQTELVEVLAVLTINTFRQAQCDTFMILTLFKQPLF